MKSASGIHIAEFLLRLSLDPKRAMRDDFRALSSPPAQLWISIFTLIHVSNKLYRTGNQTNFIDCHLVRQRS
jgi:hypothetical protein